MKRFEGQQLSSTETYKFERMSGKISNNKYAAIQLLFYLLNLFKNLLEAYNFLSMSSIRAGFRFV